MTSRRTFLKLSIASGVGYLASSCESFDRFFLGDKRILEDETVIIGAGAAGLVAALNMKKHRKPYRIYEASGQLGGRVRSYKKFELGADYFDLEDRSLISLLRELKVDFTKEEYLDPEKSFYSSGRFYSKAQLLRPMKSLIQTMDTQFKILTSQLKNSLNPKISLDESFNIRNLNSLIEMIPASYLPSREYFRASLEHEYGFEFKSLSLFHVTVCWPQLKRKYFLIGGQVGSFKKGSFDLVQSLTERVQGVVPAHLIRLNESLIEIIDRNFTNELIFSTPRGRESVFVEKIIFALPLNQLVQIKGIENYLPIKSLISQTRFGHYRSYFATPEVINNAKLPPARSRSFLAKYDKTVHWQYDPENKVINARVSPTHQPLTFNEFQKEIESLKGVIHSGNNLKIVNEHIFSHSFLDTQTIASFRPLYSDTVQIFKQSQDSKVLFVGDWTESLQMGSLEAAVKSGANLNNGLFKN